MNGDELTQPPVRKTMFSSLKRLLPCLILISAVVCLLLLILLWNPAKPKDNRDIKITWAACYNYANDLVKDHVEVEEKNEKIIDELQTKMKEVLNQGLQINTQLKEEKDLGMGIAGVDRYEPDVYTPIAKLPGQVDLQYIVKSESESTSQMRFRSPFIDDEYVRNCITGEEVRQHDRKRLFVKDLQVYDGQSEQVINRLKSFQDIFNSQSWGHHGNEQISTSGRGSTLQWSQEAIATLHTTINALKVILKKPQVKILDLACGDMTWMNRFLLTRDDVDYTGMDIVPELIEHHLKVYNEMPWKFIVYDAVHHPLTESYDLVICRMLLQHLYLHDVTKLLKNLSTSGSKYLLATTFIMESSNTELFINDNNPGRFRPLNLELPPISLVPPFCLQRDGPRHILDGWVHFLGLWKFPLKKLQTCKQKHSAVYPGTSFSFYSCCKNVKNSLR